MTVSTLPAPMQGPGGLKGQVKTLRPRDSDTKSSWRQNPALATSRPSHKPEPFTDTDQKRLPLQFPNVVVLNAVRRRNTQMRANERKRAQTQVRKRAQKSAKGRKRGLPRKIANNQVWELPIAFQGGTPPKKKSGSKKCFFSF